MARKRASVSASRWARRVSMGVLRAGRVARRQPNNVADRPWTVNADPLGGRIRPQQTVDGYVMSILQM